MCYGLSTNLEFSRELGISLDSFDLNIFLVICALTLFAPTATCANEIPQAEPLVVEINISGGSLHTEQVDYCFIIPAQFLIPESNKLNISFPLKTETPNLVRYSVLVEGEIINAPMQGVFPYIRETNSGINISRGRGGRSQQPATGSSISECDLLRARTNEEVVSHPPLPTTKQRVVTFWRFV